MFVTKGKLADINYMESAIQLAGFLSAHGIWCVSDGEPLIPMLAFEKADGMRELRRFATPELERGVEAGRDWLARNPNDAVQAVLVYDGFITLQSGKVDALLADVRLYTSSQHSILMAVPYQPVTDRRKFSVYRPKFISCDLPAPDYEALGAAFFRGVDSHAKGASVWSQSMDESL